MAEIYEPSHGLIKLLVEKIRHDKEFRLKIGCTAVVPDAELEFNHWKTYIDDPTKKIVFAHSGESFIGFFALDQISRGGMNAAAHIGIWGLSETVYKLSEMFLDYCRYEMGLSRLWGMIDSKNTAVCKFSERMGFAEAGRLPHFYPNKDGYGSAIILDLNLLKVRNDQKS